MTLKPECACQAGGGAKRRAAVWTRGLSFNAGTPRTRKLCRAYSELTTMVSARAYSRSVLRYDAALSQLSSIGYAVAAARCWRQTWQMRPFPRRRGTVAPNEGFEDTIRQNRGNRRWAGAGGRPHGQTIRWRAI